MKPPLLLFIFISVSLEALPVLVTGDNVGAYKPTDDITVDCASSTISTVDGRNWIGDVANRSDYTPIEKTPRAKGITPIISGSVTYSTARLSRYEFAYTFHVTAGPKYVRLHFFPSDYHDFRRADSLFSVKAAGYNLLHNFSASLFADYTDSPSFYKEFCLTVKEDQILNITFAPTPGNSDAYAFVNGIEVVSMPESLYYNTVVDLKEGIELADLEMWYNFSVADTLEAVKRLNVGGQFVSPADDTGMYRTWEADDEYVTSLSIGYSCMTAKRKEATSVALGALPYSDTRYSDAILNGLEIFKINNSDRNLAGSNPDPFVGPADDTGMYRTWEADDDYVTSLSIGVVRVNTTIELNYGEQVPNYTAPDMVYRTGRGMGTDKKLNPGYPLTWSVELDTNFYYLVRLHFYEFQVGIKNLTDSDFSIVIELSLAGFSEFFFFGGAGRTCLPIEIMQYSCLTTKRKAATSPWRWKLPPPARKASSSLSKAAKIAIVAGGASGFTVLSLLAFFLNRRRNRAKDSTSSDGTSWWGPVSYATTESTKTQGLSLPSDLCRHFSLAEIRAATNNFDKVFIIGVGGFGNRLNQGSQQGLHEFRTEIEMLSELRHRHLVSLIGFCKDAAEMILVYDYMAHGTLRDHLYSTDNPPLPWKRRLEICRGAACGLDYLHTGAKHTIIHRDVKTTNILLDEKWIAKVSDFGLSKVGPTSVSKRHVSMVVKGTFGYLDPEYYRRQQLTDKSDVYSFGVVLFEVLCARPAVKRTSPMEQISLAKWAQSCCKSGAVKKIVDPHLKGAIAPECLNKFCELAVSCLQDDGAKRPSMNDVVLGLEFALQLQVSADQEGTVHVGASEHDSDDNSDNEMAPIRGTGSDEVFSVSDGGGGG
ncbi:hypothetical protein BT93_J1134 [Corymbia citriodora subsp. variegata]|nr:hypothetical protein BT93_J1134 [Corymbia citriodora subsp. variegata]